jgi:S-DNA-T family DNA segregation ATPase FtsK/SpoIIIE
MAGPEGPGAMSDYFCGTPATSGPSASDAAAPSAQDAASAAHGAGQAGTSDFTAGILQATLNTRKVQAICTLAWDGPQINAYTISLGLGERPESVEALAGALALAAGAESCRLARTGGRLLLELPKPQAERRPLRATRLDTLAPPTPTAVAVGIATGGSPVWLDLADERCSHLVIGGTTGSGKSVLARWLLFRLIKQNAINQLRLILLDPKRFELKDFGQVPHLLHPITSSPLEVARVLSWVAGELDRRAESGANRPRIVVVVEEIADLTMASRDVGGLVARIGQIGRALGIHLVATTQQPGARSLGDSLVNFPCRILGRVASSTLAYGAAGRKQSGADALLGRGDFLLVAAGETVRFQAPLPDGRQWGQLPRASQVASLERELPTLVELGDRNRDPRGGRDGRTLSEADYRELEQAIRRGDASVAQIQQRFGIGYDRARRIFQSVQEGE